MKSNKILLRLSIGFLAIGVSACSTTSTNTTTNTTATTATQINASAAQANANLTTNTAANSTAANTAQANSSTIANPGTDSLATPTDTFKTFYTAMATRDEDRFRKSLSKESLASMDKILSDPRIKNEGYTRTVDFVVDGLELARVPTQMPDIVSEKVTGNKAVLSVRFSQTGQTEEIFFVKEGNDWKLEQSPEQKREAQAALEKAKRLKQQNSSGR